MVNAIPQDSQGMPCKAPRSFSSTNSRRALTCALLECFARSTYCLILQLAAIADTGLVPVLWKLGGKCSVSSGAYPSPVCRAKNTGQRIRHSLLSLGMNMASTKDAQKATESLISDMSILFGSQRQNQTADSCSLCKQASFISRAAGVLCHPCFESIETHTAPDKQ